MYYYNTHKNSGRGVRVLLAIFLTAAIIGMPQMQPLAYAEGDPPVEASPTVPSANEQSLIATGDALAGTELETVVNTTETTVDSAPGENTTTTPVASVPVGELPPDQSPEQLPVDSGTEMLSGEVGTATATGTEPTASTSANAVVANEVAVNATTGENTASSSSLIVTGDAIAYANVVNIVNTDILNSNGMIGFFNEALGVNSFDLRDAFAQVFSDTTAPQSTVPCTPAACGSAPLTQNISNGATITNDVVVRADTGSNSAGSGAIVTGDAYAAANVFNLANTTIADSNYLLIAFNNFGDYGGDIVLPSAEAMSTLFSAGGASLSSLTADVTNDASIATELAVSAETGSNTSGGGLIETGDATAHATTENIVNTNLFGGSDFLLVLRVHGNWDGDIFGLPEGISWTETENGIALYRTGSAVGDTLSTNTTVSNTASITNNISVFALTGDNRLGGDGAIVTGDAYAAANVTNVANTTVLGQNWALLVFDIFGDWSGNLAFGKPDLWIGGEATPAVSQVVPGTDIAYTYTIVNNGDATASDVVVKHRFNPGELVYTSDIDRLSSDDDGMYGTWNIGDIPPRGTKTVSFETKVNPGLDMALREIVTEATVTSIEPDANMDDNTEYLGVYSGVERRSGKGRSSSPKAVVEVVKEASADIVPHGGSVDYTITATNNGGPVYDALVHDTLRNAEGEISSEQYWDLGTLHAGETVSITYTTEFAQDAAYGMYTNSAEVVGYHRTSNRAVHVPYTSPSATYSVQVGDPVPKVLGAATCAPYLTTYMRPGVTNDATEVIKLQEFLNTHMGNTLSLTGVFDLPTEVAVRDFQSHYALDILGPWGLSRSSGYVYYTTQKKINEIQCNNMHMFPLSASQNKEILFFRDSLLTRNVTTYSMTTQGELATTQGDEPASTPSSNENIIVPTSPAAVTTGSYEMNVRPNRPDRSLPMTDFFMNSLKKMLHWFGSVAVR